MTSLNTIRNILSAAILLSIFLPGCGAKKSAYESTSRGTGTTLPPSNYKLGECNRINFSSWSVTGQIGTHYDLGTGKYREDYLNMNLTSVPADIYTNSVYNIVFLRWSKQKVMNQIPTKFYFMDKLSGQVTTASYDRISFANLTSAKKFFGTSWTNISVSQFFARAMIILTGMDITYDALEIQLLDTTKGNIKVAGGDVLLPAFYANPSIYMQFRAYPELYSLHPNYSLLSSGASENDFFQQIESICSDLAGIGTRIPSSISLKKVSWWAQMLNSTKGFFSQLSIKFGW